MGGTDDPAKDASGAGAQWAIVGREDGELAGAFPDVRALADVETLRRAVDDGVGAPAVVLADCTQIAGETPGAVRATVLRALEMLQGWLADERLASSRFAIVTSRSVAGRVEEDVCNLAGASLWGLARSAQAENPGRLVLLDVDGEPSSWAALAGALARGEPQMLVRDGAVSAPRLARAIDHGDRTGEQTPWFEPQGTILITGGTGGLGATVARHLVASHEARHLLLVSRSGMHADGASELMEELSGLGAQVKIVACDVSDRGQAAGTACRDLAGASADRRGARRRGARRRCDRLSDA